MRVSTRDGQGVKLQCWCRAHRSRAGPAGPCWWQRQMQSSEKLRRTSVADASDPGSSEH